MENGRLPTNTAAHVQYTYVYFTVTPSSSCLMRAENNHLSLLPRQCPSCPMSISYLSFHSLLKQTLLSMRHTHYNAMFSFYCLSFGILFIQTSCRNFRWQIHLKTNLQNSRFSLKPDKINIYIFISSAWIFFYPILVTKCMRLKRKGELINFQPPCMDKVRFFPSVVRSTLPGCAVNAVYAACLSLHWLLSEHSFIRELSINLRKL